MERKIFWYPFELSAQADQSIVSEIAKKPSLDFSDILFLTTSLRRSRRLERLFAKEIKEKRRAETISPPFFTTLDAFVKDFFQRVNPLNFILSDEEKSYLLAQILSKKEDEKVNWKVVYSYQSLIKELKSYFLAEREELDRKINRFFLKEKESSRLDYLSSEQAYRRISQALEVFDKYRSFLKENRLYDLEDAFSVVAENLSSDNFNYREVWIDNFYDFTPLSWYLIERVVRASKKVVVVSGWESKPSDHPLYLLTHETFLSFEKLLETKRQPLLEKTKSRKGEILFQSAKNRHDEVKQIARKICYLARKEDVRLSEIVVTFPNPLSYLSHLKTLFSRYRIPYNLSHGFPLKSSPTIKSVLDLVSCANDNYPRRLVVNLVRSPFFNLVSADLGLFIDFCSRKNGVVKGRESWVECFNEKFFSKEERKEAKEARKIFKKIFGCLKDLKKRKSLSYFNQSLFSVLEEFGFFEKIKSLSREEKAELKSWQAFAEKLNKLESFSQKFFPKEISLSQYLNILKMVVESGKYWVEGEETAGVQIVGVLEARGIGYRYLFFGGLADEVYPGKVTKELFFSEKLKEEIGLPTYSRRFSLFRYNFKRLINSAPFAFLSFPQSEGREIFLKSRFFSDLDLDKGTWFVPENILLAPFEFQRHWLELKDKEFLNNLIDKKTIQLIKEQRGKLIKKTKVERDRIELSNYQPPTEITVTDLEKYNRCGFIFLYEVILKLNLLEEPEEEIQPSFWGKMVHDFLAVAFRKDVTDLSREELEKYLKREALNFFPLSLSSGYGLLKKWQLDSVIEKIAAVEAERFSQGFRPLFFEKPVEFEIGGLKLKGRIDRIDSFRDEGYFLIDYKTKHNLTGEKVVKVRRIFSQDLQLFLYAQGLPKKVLGVGYYILHEANVGLDDYYLRELASFFSRSKERKFFEDYFEEKIEKAQRIVEKIKQGVFEKNENACFNCRFRGVCLDGSL